MERPLVSVIMPVYNTELYLREAVESILRQTLQNIEVILINDGSTDRSLSILSELAIQDRRIKLFSQNNQGLSITRNNGMEEAIGEYIYFMDSDDILEADAFECCYNLCQAQKLDFVYFDADVFRDNESVIADISAFDYRRKTMIPKLTANGINVLETQIRACEFRSPVWLNFVSNQFLKQNSLKFYPSIIHEDQLFTVLLYLQASRVSYIDRVFFHRRVRVNSIMTNGFNMSNMDGYFTVAYELKRKRTEKDRQAKGVIDLFLRQMLDAAVWNAYVMPIGDRLKLFLLCVFRWRKYVSMRTCVVLLLKKIYT